MPIITYKNVAYQCNDNESVLDALLRHGIAIPYGCKAGVCNSCLMVTDDPSTVSGHAIEGLKNTLIDHGVFRSCQCIPTQAMTVNDAGPMGHFVNATLIAHDRLAEDIYRLRLVPDRPLHYHAGQYLNLRVPEGYIRSYSLASVAEHDPFLELHIKRVSGGTVSPWLCDEATIGSSLEIQGPFGSCYYLSDNPDSPLLLIGTGTGLAPLWGIMRDAIARGHQGPIALYHGAKEASGLYYHDIVNDFAAQHDRIHYHGCVSAHHVGSDDPAVIHGRATDVAFSDHPQLQGYNVYLCGLPAMVSSGRKVAYLSGADLGHIYADAFFTQADVKS